MPRRRRHHSKNWKFLLGVAIGLLPALIFTGVSVPASNFDSPLADQSPTTSTVEDQLLIHPEDAEYMDRIFVERDHEIGYCVSVNDGRLSFWLADTVEASESSMTMKTANCPSDLRDATAHTHPSGSTGLSTEDQEALHTNDETIMCIHAGRIKSEPGTELDNLVCYREAEFGHPVRIPVQVAESAPDPTHRLRGTR